MHFHAGQRPLFPVIPGADKSDMPELLEIIEWLDDSRDTLSYRFPDEDRAIKRGAQLIVRESQAAQFVYLGQYADTFGPGKYSLITDNIPVLSRIKGWKYGFESPFKADVYFVTTRLFAGNQWGTTNPVMLRDADLGVVRVRAFGTYDFRIVDAKRFLGEVAGTDEHFQLADFSNAMRSRIVSVFSQALATSHIPVLDAAGRYAELGEALLPLINPALTAKYGLEMAAFVVENVSVPPEVEQAIDKRSSIASIQNLNDYVKYQVAQGIAGGTAGTAAVGAELAVGMSIAQRMLAEPAGIAGSSAAPATVAAAALILTPAEVAAVLKVTEAEVVSSLEAGVLKGKRIGTEWRVTRAALDQFLQ
jgi:excisionase family DNA binding protein